MKIAINCAFYQPQGGGIKEYVFNLTHHLAKLDTENEYILYVLQDQMAYAKTNLPEIFQIKPIPYNSQRLTDVIARSLFEQRFWLKEERLEKWDIFHSPFFHAPKLKNAKLLLTVHDLRFYRFPKTYTRLRYLFLKYKVRASICRADHIIAISNFTKKEIMEAYQIDGNKISVVHEAINPERFTGAHIDSTVQNSAFVRQLGTAPFLLSVGHLEPRKNYVRLIEAFILLKRQVPELADLKLVIVGKPGHSYEKTLLLIASRDDIYYPNFVEHSLLIWLYKHASLFVLPSYYEGFGFPPLEAAALGTVSAVSHISSMPEICGNAVFYFDPFDTNSIVAALTEALQCPGAYEAKKAQLPTQLDKFSWERNAMETISVYKAIKKCPLTNENSATY